MLVVVGGVVAQRQRRTMLALNAAEARARKDQLTGLLNRTAVEERLAEELARAARYQLAVSVLMIDLDDFKRLNDSRGHLIGDLALVAVGGLLLGDKRVSDSAARLGGEEFLVLLPETGEDEAATIADRLRLKIAGTNTSGAYLSASIGVACYPDHARTSVELLMAADSALYAAKSAGKNRVAVYDHTTSRPIRMVPGDPGFAAALARRATEIATDRGMDGELVQAVRMAALAEVFEGHPIADSEITTIIATARDQLVRELTESDGFGTS
jgi:diguanylate cyclase (GGDEF)-like protein